MFRVRIAINWEKAAISENSCQLKFNPVADSICLESTDTNTNKTKKENIRT
jgi:hypothetical protein